MEPEDTPNQGVAQGGPEAAAGSEGENESVQAAHVDDARYSFDSGKLGELRKEAPWTKEAKYFQKVALSPSAIIKMMMHCQSGVTKGIKKGGNPIEVMGMLLGRPDPDTPRTLVVTDAFPLPIEGFETRVVADDADVVNHMISLGECLERTRKEKFMGWYHSHPFDLGDHSHCFLSQTDLSTQLQWQRAEDPHGNPFVAIVLDPLRSLHRSYPELKAFRAYPPEYNSPVENECPNGTIEQTEQTRLELWGSCWNRYYELNIEYFMSSYARQVMEHLTQDYLWMRTLGTTTTDAESQKRLPLRIKAVNTHLQQQGGASSESKGYGAFRSVRATSGGAPSAPSQKSGADSSDALEKAVQQVVDIATEQLHGSTLDKTKKQLFSRQP